MQQESLRSKTIKGVGWSAVDAFLGQGVTFIVGLVLARLLSPDEYGLIGICLIFTTVLNGIVDSGFSNALIRKKNVTDEDYNTMFITNMVISIVLYVLLFFSAPFVSDFFKREELTSLVRATGLVLFFNALSITQITILTKRIDFKTKTRASIISAVASGIVGIAMALYGLGVWSLVGQIVSKQFLYTLCLWFINRWYPTFRFSLNSFMYMWNFGWKILASGLLNNIWNQLYQVVVGKYYSPATLGQYTRSNQFASLFSDNFTTIIQRVSFPILANIQDDTERLMLAYKKIIKTTMFITVFIMFILGAVSEPLIHWLLGDKWHEAALFLPLICLNMSLYPLHAINLNMLQIQGKSDIFLKLEIIKKVVAIFPILIGIFVSIYYMLIASVITGFIAFFLNSYYTGKELKYTSFEQLKDVAPFYVIGFTIGGFVYFLKYLPLANLCILLIQLFISVFLLLIICTIVKLPEFMEIKKIVMNLFRKNQ